MFELNKNISSFIIGLESKKRSDDIYEQNRQLPEPEYKAIKKVKDGANFSGSKTYECEECEPSKIHKEALRILRFWLSCQCIYLFQSELLKKAGIYGGAKGAQIKKFFVRMGWIIVHTLQKGKSFLSIWEPTEKAINLVGNGKVRPRSKGGGYLHDFSNKHIEQYGVRNDYRVELEFLLANGKSVDQVHSKNNELVFYEICMSPPLEKEISNLIKDFSTDLKPDQAIIACKDGKMKKILEKMIESNTELAVYRDRIRVCLAGDFVQCDIKSKQGDNNCIE